LCVQVCIKVNGYLQPEQLARHSVYVRQVSVLQLGTHCKSQFFVCLVLPSLWQH